MTAAQEAVILEHRPIVDEASGEDFWACGYAGEQPWTEIPWNAAHVLSALAHQSRTPDEYAPMFGTPISAWYRWFAWHPVETVDRGYRWFRFVWRRRIEKRGYLPGPFDRWFQHACVVPTSHSFGGSDD